MRANRMAFSEGVQVASFCRLPTARSKLSLFAPNAHVVSSQSSCRNACCRRRRFSSTVARLQEPHWHHHNGRSTPYLLKSHVRTPVGCNGGDNTVHLWGKSNLSCSYSSSTLMAWGRANNVHPSNVTGLQYKCSYRSSRERTFATVDGTNQSAGSRPKPTPEPDGDGISEGAADDERSPEEPKIKTAVPKEFIEAIQSEVEEMESASPSSPSSAAMKSPEDFGVRRQNFGQNELKRQASKTTSKVTSTSVHDEGQQFACLEKTPEDFAAYLTEEEGKSSVACEDSNNVKQSTNDDQSASQEPPPSATQQHYGYYKFSPKDATLSDPQRHVDRRRAIEAKLQAQLAESRAATMKNVRRALGGNAIIALAKLGAAISSGSSAMLSEFVHSVVDCGNQALLLVGLNSSRNAPDRSHPYGYGKAVYFWALVSALGTFFLGAGVSATHAVGELFHPSMTGEVTKEVWGVLIISFAVDGYVFGKTLQGVAASMRVDGEGGTRDMSLWKYATTKVRDPATLAVLLEDGAACLGVVLAIGGIGMTQYTGMPIWDGMAGVGIAGLLAAMGVALANVNHRFLIGQGIDKATREDIEKIITSRRSIDNVYSVQSQWTGPDTFSYKAEVDFDGTFLAAKLLPRYQQEFFDAKLTLDRDLRVLLSWYAEDVMRTVEREVRHIEEEIRMKYPEAHYIELEPMSKDADRYAIDDGMQAQLRRVEIDVLNRYLKSLYKIKEKEGGPSAIESSQQPPQPNPEK